METTILNAISTVGFPIAAYLLMYVDLRKLIQRQTNLITKLIQEHDIWERKEKSL